MTKHNLYKHPKKDCLKCKKPFAPNGSFNRICLPCTKVNAKTCVNINSQISGTDKPTYSPHNY